MESKLARIISYIFHPLVIPLLSLFLILKLQTFEVQLLPGSVKWLVLSMVAVASTAFPILLVMLFIRKGIVNSIQLEGKEERLYPYLIVCIVYYVMYLLFNSIHLPGIVTNFILGVAILLLLVLVINFWWKISIHMIAAGGMTGTFTGIAIRYNLNLVWLVALMVGISGLVGFARLKLNAHTGSQVYLGWLAGMAGMLLLYLLI